MINRQKNRLYAADCVSLSLSHQRILENDEPISSTRYYYKLVERERITRAVEAAQLEALKKTTEAKR